MGLAERRAIKNFQEAEFPKIKQQVDAVAGFEVAVNVAWDTLAEDDYGHLLGESIPKVYFKPLIEALREICVDELGKDALKGGLKTVEIRWSGQKTLDFKDGVLTIDHSPISNIDYWEERKKELQRELEQGL